jgi:outer membrane protein assembly factor BamE (lipoprotein component of BamABCDE complex)
MRHPTSSQQRRGVDRSGPGFGTRGALGCCTALLLLAGCAATTVKHGHLLNENDLQQVQPGMSQDAVRNALGTPDTTSTVASGNAFYYISSTTKEVAFLKPEEVDRRVIAVYFNQVGSVEKVANYGLKDGKVFDFASRETPAYMRDRNLISRFFRGVGPKTKLFDEDKK